MVNLKGKDLLSLVHISTDEIYSILAKGLELKRKRRSKTQGLPLSGRTMAMIFEKPSTRTRVSFEVAAADLGMHPIFLRNDELQLGRSETVEDTAKVLSRYVDIIVMRTFEQERIEVLAEAAKVPVINALSDLFHPCQALSDLMTILEKKDHLANLKIAYVGDGNNVCNCLMIGSAKVGANFSVASPKGYEPKAEILKIAEKNAKGNKQRIEVFNDPAEAVKGADVIYTDVWTSMGQEKENDKRLKAFKNYQVNKELVSQAKRTAIVMHCLPAHRGEEITNDVLDGKQSVVLDQAENRLHVQKALLVSIL